jgi:hypothetical protein
MTIEVRAARAIAFFFDDTYAFARQGKGVGRAEAAGTIKWLLRQEAFHLYGVTPAASFSFLCSQFNLSSKTVKGTQAKKQTTMNILHRHRNFYTTNDNIADAYVLSMFGYAFLVEKKKLSVRPLCRLV